MSGYVALSVVVVLLNLYDVSKETIDYGECSPHFIDPLHPWTVDADRAFLCEK